MKSVNVGEKQTEWKMLTLRRQSQQMTDKKIFVIVNVIYSITNDRKYLFLTRNLDNYP